MPYLLKLYLSDKLCPTGVCRGTQCLQVIPYKEQLMAMYNLQLLQTAFRPRPPTTKIQIASPCKNRLPGQFTEPSESGLEATVAK